jgi:hypothetical protein
MILPRFLTLFVVALFAGARPGALAKAYYAPADEMIRRAEVIAIVDISHVVHAKTKAKPFDYSEIAHATVQQTLKGALPQKVKLYGGESFICAQVHFAPGRYLVFLGRAHDLLVGCNWHLSVRPIKGAEVEWYAPGETLKLSWQRLLPVLKRIENSSATPKGLGAPAEAVDEKAIPSQNSFVEVLGDVRKPGKILWSPDLTVTKAVTMCGGPGWRYQRRGFIVRGGERIAVLPAAIVRGKEPDVKLEPGDKLDLSVQ